MQLFKRKKQDFDDPFGSDPLQHPRLFHGDHRPGVTGIRALKGKEPVCRVVVDVSNVVANYLQFLVHGVEAESSEAQFCSKTGRNSGIIQQRLLAAFGQCAENMQPFRITGWRHAGHAFLYV